MAAPAAPEDDAAHMRRALDLAARGWGRVSPNPLVGAVAVKEGRVVGEGWHAEFGAPHAEAVALRRAGPEARGSTLYVTLEPCAHEGKTPACARAILASGVGRVVAACRDPHPEAAGGLEALREAGLEVEVGVEAAAAARLNAAFLWSHRRGTPFTTLKLALSLDARLAAAPGRSTSVTGREARREAHRLRAGHDAVLVGRRTAAVDDPRLTVREAAAPRRPPVRVVLDPDLRLSPGARLVRTADEAPVWVLAAPDAPVSRWEALEANGARVEAVARGEHGLDLEAAWRLLREAGIRSVLVEGGGEVASSVLEARLAQRLHLFYAPVLFGPEGVEAFPRVPGDGLGRWEVVARRALGRDTALVLEPPGLPDVLLGG